MSLLEVMTGSGSGRNSLLEERPIPAEKTLQLLSDLVNISSTLDLNALLSALEYKSSLFDALLSTVNGLLGINIDARTINELLSAGQLSLARGVLNAVRNLLKEQASEASIRDLIATVKASIEPLQAIAEVAQHLPTFLFLTTAAGSINPSVEMLPQKPSQLEKAFALRVVPALS